MPRHLNGPRVRLDLRRAVPPTRDRHRPREERGQVVASRDDERSAALLRRCESTRAGFVPDPRRASSPRGAVRVRASVPPPARARSRSRQPTRNLCLGGPSSSPGCGRRTRIEIWLTFTQSPIETLVVVGSTQRGRPAGRKRESPGLSPSKDVASSSAGSDRVSRPPSARTPFVGTATRPPRDRIVGR